MIDQTASDQPIAPEDAMPTEWPTDDRGDTQIDNHLFLLAGLVNHLPGQRAVLIALSQHIFECSRDWPACCSQAYPELKLTLL